MARLAAALIFLAAALPAQTVHGRLLADQPPQPAIGGARVWLLDSARAVIDTAKTDTSGTFRLRALRPGKYMLQARRIGYQIVTSPPFRLAAGQDATFNFVVVSKAVELPAVSVNAKREAEKRLRLFGIDPRTLGARRITRERLEELDDGSRTIADAMRLQNIPGLFVDEYPDGRLCIYRNRATPGTPGGDCMALIVDGVPYDDVASFRPGEFDLVLVLDGSTAVSLFGTNAENGAVMFFTHGNAP